MSKIFFTLNDFSKDGGSTVRIYGIINALARQSKSEKIILISNATDYSQFHPSIKHIYIGVKFSPKEKRVFQGLLTIMPISIVFKLFSNKIDQIYNKLRFLRSENIKNLVFFTYLDNSLAYLLFRKSRIPFYVNDIHGIATIEFKYKEYISIKQKVTNILKHFFSQMLDRKVFKFAKGFIFVSKAMEQYFKNEYPFINDKTSIIIQDGINKELCSQKVDNSLLKDVQNKYKINKQDKVVLFIGRFKNFGGIIDLIEAFNLVTKTMKDIKLILIGDGEDGAYAKSLVSRYNLTDNIIFINPIPYSKLVTYQELADIIVCPDKNHPYSQMVPHIKYFNALVSSKPVINGSFTVIKAINCNERLSVDFEPSNIIDLSNKIIYCLENLELLNEKYKNNKQIVCNEFLYENNIKELL